MATSPTAPEKLRNKLRSWDLAAARGMASLGALIGTLDLLGWQFDAELLTRLIPGFPTMKPLTGLCFILVAAATLLLDRGISTHTSRTRERRMRVAAGFLALAVLCVGTWAILEDRIGPGHGIDRLLFPSSTSRVYGADSGRIPVATGIVFALLATALLLVAADGTHRRPWHQLPAVAAATIGFMGILGYAYSTAHGHTFAPIEMMALNSAMAALLLSVAMLFLQPNTGVMETFNSPLFGGLLARRMLPVALTLPFVLGWFRLRGEQLGYYGEEFGLTLFACSATILFALLIWWSARSLNRLDRLREESKAFEASRRDILEEIASGQPLAVILESIVKLVESRNVDARCSILLYDGASGKLLDGAGAKLPREYREKIHGIAVGPDVGSCGTAAFYGKRVIVEDIATHPYWANFRELALGFGLRSCWSSPIFSAGGTVLGTFAVYGDKPKVPTAEELTSVDSATDLASIAIERRNAEDALRTSEAQLRFLFENAGLGMAMATVSGKLIKCNPAFCNMLGYTENEFLQLDSTKLTFPEDLAADRKRFEALRTGELASIQYMKRYLHRTGRVIYANLNVSVVKSEDGVPLYVVGIVEDITARHIAEAENARVQAHAEQSQRLQALGTLAGGIAHDFNNILTAIAGNAEFAGKAIGENAQARLHLDRISEAATRATGLVAQILVFGRLQTAERKPTVLQPVIEEALNLLRATLPAKITIKTDLDPTVPAVLADSTQMHQILMNLGTNAAHALTQRGGVIHVSLGVAELSDRQLAGLAAGSYVRLTVSDTGAGMNKEVLAHLFEPFFTTKAQGEGTGLGLSVVHGIVSSYGGAIQVASAPGAGARFDLYFPPAPEGVAIKSAPVAAERRGTGERILVIDDEPAVAEVSQYQLEQNGYRPIVFTNPLSALERFAGEPDSFDCVLTDLSMPGCSGLDVAKAIRELRPKIPVVLASGFLPAEEQEAAAKLGIAAFLPKPYRTAKLLETLARVLSLEPAELPPTH